MIRAVGGAVYRPASRLNASNRLTAIFHGSRQGVTSGSRFYFTTFYFFRMKLTKLYHRIFDGVICAIALILYMCLRKRFEEVRPDDTSASVAFRASGTTESAVGSFEGDLMLDFSAPAGTSYTISVTEGGSWCWTSRLHQSTEKPPSWQPPCSRKRSISPRISRPRARRVSP